MEGKHSLSPGSPLGRFVGIVDSEMHRVNLLYLLNGYHVKYSLAVAATLLLLVLTFLFPTERTTHGSVLSLATESFTLLMVAGALFRATGGVFTRRQHQEEWLLGNVKDVIHALLEKGSSPKLCLMLLLGLEIIAEFGKVLQGATCLFVLLLLWIGWLLLR